MVFSALKTQGFSPKEVLLWEIMRIKERCAPVSGAQRTRFIGFEDLSQRGKSVVLFVFLCIRGLRKGSVAVFFGIFRLAVGVRGVFCRAAVVLPFALFPGDARLSLESVKADDIDGDIFEEIEGGDE